MKKDKLFDQIGIDLVEGCNRRCKWCPYYQAKYRKTFGNKMKEETFIKILKELQELDFKGKISPYSLGEPLLNPDLIRHLKLIREYLPEAYIFILTNGTLIKDRKHIESLVNAGVSHFEVNCYEKAHYEKLKQYNDMDRVSIRPKYTPYIRRTFITRASNIRVDDAPEIGGELATKYCERPFQRIVIDSSGKVLMCCADYGKEEVAGDLTHQSIVEVWNSPLFKKYRKYLKEGNRKPLKLCRKCNYPKKYEGNN